MHAHRCVTACLALALIIAVGTGVSTHRRDEYLQAARIVIEPAAVDVDMDLTPGIDVAASFIEAIDTDRDGSLSADEQRRYADGAVRALAMAVDRTPLSVRLTASTFPDLLAVRRGEGTIALRAHAALPRLSPGAHQLSFKNAQGRGQRAYLANALVPDSARVSVTAQHRTEDQSELTIDYALRGETTGVWLLVSLAGAAVLLAPLTRRLRT
jgi:hypothetical protein